MTSEAFLAHHPAAEVVAENGVARVLALACGTRIDCQQMLSVTETGLVDKSETMPAPHVRILESFLQG